MKIPDVIIHEVKHSLYCLDEIYKLNDLLEKYKEEWLRDRQEVYGRIRVSNYDQTRIQSNVYNFDNPVISMFTEIDNLDKNYYATIKPIRVKLERLKEVATFLLEEDEETRDVLRHLYLIHLPRGDIVKLLDLTLLELSQIEHRGIMNIARKCYENNTFARRDYE